MSTREEKKDTRTAQRRRKTRVQSLLEAEEARAGFHVQRRNRYFDLEIEVGRKRGKRGDGRGRSDSARNLDASSLSSPFTHLVYHTGTELLEFRQGHGTDMQGASFLRVRSNYNIENRHGNELHAVRPSVRLGHLATCPPREVSTPDL